jgi:LAO/AO transport system kinase
MTVPPGVRGGVGAACPRNARDLIAAARGGSLRAAGQLLSLVEGHGRDEVLSALDIAGTARVVGFTRPPGAGKSTTVAAIVGAYRVRGQRVAVLAVDPSSPYTGGALLGDRVRMAAHIDDPGVLIRSVASRGYLGGLAAAVPAAIRLLSALAYDLIVLERSASGSRRSKSPRSPIPPSSFSVPAAAMRSRPQRRACWKSPTSS